MIKKIQGAIISGAIGDALGFIIEKQSITTVKSFCYQLDKENSYSIPFRTYPKNFQFGQYSDDTQFTKILATSFLENKNFKDLLCQEFKKGNLVGLGKNTKNLLNLYSKNKEVIPEMTHNISNGALMRSWVIGLLFSNQDKIKEESINHSKITHDSPESLLTCNFLAQTINLIIQKPSFNKNDIIQLFPSEYVDLLNQALILKNEEELRQLLIFKPLEKEWEGVPPLAVQTLVGSLVSFLNHKDDSLKHLLCSTFLLGGDTDSTGSIAGALWGAYNGIDKVDKMFRNIVYDNNSHQEDYLLELGIKVSNFRTKS